MPDNNLRGKLRGAYLPYVRGFLRQAGKARLSVSIDDDSIVAELRLAPSDFRKFDGDVVLRSEQRRAFNNLARANDPNRAPSLWFERLT